MLEREAVSLARTRIGVEVALRRVALVGGFALLTALGAQVRIPLTPVPITMQTFFVLLGGLMLGANLGATAQLLYLTLGAFGAPIFAGKAVGLTYLLGPTGGYLMGFVASAWLVGQLARSVNRASPRAGIQALAILAVGTVTVYVPGVFWLVRGMGMSPWSALGAGVLPFLPGDALKAVLAAAIWLRLVRR